MKDPLVSICCITFNHGPYIRECLEGFMMQQCDFGFEILIHDDASTDGTSEIIREYQEKYPGIIKPIIQTENQWAKGIKGHNRRLNFPRAKGKYIAMCEGDDYWIDPLKLQKQVDFLETYTNFSMCFHNANRLNQIDEQNDTFYPVVENREYNLNEVFLHWIVPTASIVFRSSIVNLISENLKDKRVLNGDLILVLSCFSKGRVMGMSNYMSVYRIHEEGISYSRFEKNKIKHLRNYLSHYKMIKERFPLLKLKYINIKLVDIHMSLAKIFFLKRNPISLIHLLYAIYYRPELIVKGLKKLWK